MAVLAGVRQSFAQAEQLLAELSGWDLDDETIRRATHAAAPCGRGGAAGAPDAGRFARTPGVIEVPIDAGKVNTTEGWRDVKVAVFAKREEGEPATPEEWAERELPAPAVRTVVAAVEEAGTFAGRVRAEADRLGVTAAADVTVLGDGAEWIWNLAGEIVPQAGGVLDIYHAVEHVAGAAKALWGDGAAETAAQLEAGRPGVLSGGKAGWSSGSARRSTTSRRASRPSRCGSWPPTSPSTRHAWATRGGWRAGGASAAVWWKGASSNWSTCG